MSNQIKDLHGKQTCSNNLHERHNVTIEKPRKPDPHTKLLGLWRHHTSYEISISESRTIMVDMMKVLEYALETVLYTECLAGFLINIIPLAAVILKWKTLRCLQTCYKILSCLLFCRSLYLLSSFFYQIIIIFYPWVLLDMVIVVTLNIEMMFINYTNLWFATVLCVFYCVKITTYNWKFWIILKTKISTAVSWFLLASLIISGSSSLAFGFYLYDFEPKNVTQGAMENMTLFNDGPPINLQKQFLTFLLGSGPPFLIFCIAICLLLHSLWMHTRRMRSSGSGFGSPNLESHFRAVKSMSLFLGLQIIYFITLSVIFSGTLDHSKVWQWLFAIITSSPLFLHSLYIIYSNSDLRKTCISMFHALTGGAPS